MTTMTWQQWWWLLFFSKKAISYYRPLFLAEACNSVRIKCFYCFLTFGPCWLRLARVSPWHFWATFIKRIYIQGCLVFCCLGYFLYRSSNLLLLGGTPPKVYHRLSHRFCFKNSLRHLAHPSLKFCMGQKVHNLASIFHPLPICVTLISIISNLYGL